MFGCDAVNRALGQFDRVDDRLGCDRRRSGFPGQEGYFTEEIAGAKFRQLKMLTAFASCEDLDLSGDQEEEAVSFFTLSDDDVALLIRTEAGRFQEILESLRWESREKCRCLPLLVFGGRSLYWKGLSMFLAFVIA